MTLLCSGRSATALLAEETQLVFGEGELLPPVTMSCSTSGLLSADTQLEFDEVPPPVAQACSSTGVASGDGEAQAGSSSSSSVAGASMLQRKKSTFDLEDGAGEVDVTRACRKQTCWQALMKQQVDDPDCGPASLSECDDWPFTIIDTLAREGRSPKLDDTKASPEALDTSPTFRRFCKNMQKLVVSTHYSGMDMFDLGLRMLVKALTMRGINLTGDFPNVHACDIDESCQRLLTRYAKPSQADHVFKDVLDRLPSNVKSDLMNISPPKKGAK